MTDPQQPVLFAEDTKDNGAILNDAPAHTRTTKKAKRPKEPLTSKQQLSTTIKSVRDLLQRCWAFRRYGPAATTDLAAFSQEH